MELGDSEKAMLEPHFHIQTWECLACTVCSKDLLGPPQPGYDLWACLSFILKTKGPQSIEEIQVYLVQFPVR